MRISGWKRGLELSSQGLTANRKTINTEHTQTQNHQAQNQLDIPQCTIEFHHTTIQIPEINHKT